MNLRQNRRPPPEINLAPLIDVVFILLIFFMVTTTFKEDSRLRLNLPEANGEPPAAAEVERVEVTIDAGGRTFVGDAAVLNDTPEALRVGMLTAIGERRDLPVLIKADAATPHQAVIRVLDVASQLGLRQIAFAASHAVDDAKGAP